MAMKILITNDDSIRASQLLPLIRWFQTMGEVTTVVPKYEQSGKSHGIELHKPFLVTQEELAPGVTAWAVDSTPADCVRYAVLGMGEKFDLVISGINRGLNIGADIMYSGTVAAVREAGFLGIPAIALSTSPEYYDHAVEHLDWIFEYIHRRQLLKVHHIYNINIPPQPGEIRITRQGGPYYSDDFLLDEDSMCTPKGKCVYAPTGDLSVDTDAAMNVYISIMPLAVDMTQTEVFRQLTE